MTLQLKFKGLNYAAIYSTCSLLLACFRVLTLCRPSEKATQGNIGCIIMFYYKWVFKSLWRNRLARSTVNRKVGGSSPPRDGLFIS